ncbi:MAG: minor capsid protein, partial [Lachnospirales bacterium]
MKSSDYWKERFTLIEEDAYKKSSKLAREIEENFRYTLTNIEKDIVIWYNRFAVNNEISYNEARRLIESKELKELGWDVEEYIKKGKDNAITNLWDKELENASAKFHINRLEALKLRVQQYCEKMYGNMTDSLDKTIKNIYTDSYYKTCYEVQNGFSTFFDVAKIGDNMLNMIVNKPWADDGTNFSERIWGKYRPTLVNKLHRELTDCIIRGDNPNNLTELFAKQFKTSLGAANRLIVSEYSYFNALSVENSLNGLGVEEFEVCETLDFNTCEKCQSMDGKHFPMSEYKIGTTVPPLHTNCRGTACPYFDDEFTKDEMRAARDEKGETYYTKCKNYKEWKEKFIKDKGQQTWDYYEKSTKNKIADQEQFDRYKDILGKNAPKTLEEFQKIKYNDSEIWSQFKAYTNSIKSGELTPLADFNLYKSKCLEVSDKIIGITTANGIEVEGRTKHLIARIIGSVEDKRSGVDVSDIIRALKEPSEIKQIRYFANGPSQKFVLENV